MYSQISHNAGRKVQQNRRSFLQMVSGVAGGIAFGGLHIAAGQAQRKADNNPLAAAMPKIQLGSHTISRLVLGANPVWGISYQGKLMGKFMTDYYSDENIMKLLHHAEQSGVTAWQASPHERLAGIWKRYKEAGGNMHLIMLHHDKKCPLKEVADLQPIAVVHHGGVTDRFWVGGELETVHEYVKRTKDLGIMAGVSCHKPEVLEEINSQDWEHDFYMACFYNMTRSKDEWKSMIGFKPFQYIFHGDDPGRMCRVIQNVSKPVLGFKILAGGWAADKKPLTDKAFKFAFQNIKLSDGVIVGMLPVFDDQVTENVRHTITYGSSV